MEEKPIEQPQSEQDNTLDSLEGAETTVVSANTGNEIQNVSDPTGLQAPKPEKQKRTFKQVVTHIFRRFNVYLLLFLLVVLLALIVVFVSYNRDKSNEAKTTDINTQPLSQDILDQLRQTDVTVGDPKQILKVEANAVFAGKVLIKDGLEVAGQLKLGGPLNVPGITASGTSTFDKLQASNFQVSGDTILQGQTTVQKGLSVAGNLSVGGALSAAQLSIEGLQLNGDLHFNRHIDAGGGTPGRSNGGALGSGGTSSNSGTDTAGTININTGGGPVAGCFVNISFVQKFNDTPHVVVTPVGFAAGGLAYYINRSNSGFSICTANNPPAGQSFSFDYIVID